MATEIVDITQSMNISGFGSSMATIFYWLVFLVGFAGLMWWVYRQLQFKHDFIIHDMTREGTITIKDKLWVKKNVKTGTIEWRLKKSRCRVPIAPKDAISLGIKGRYFIEAFRTVDGEYDYINVDWSKADAVGSKFPLRNNDKDFYAQEVVDAEKYKQKNSWKDVAIVAAPYLAIIIIFVCFLVFFDQVLVPAQELAGTISGATDKLGNVLDSMASCSQSFESSGSLNNNNVVVPN